MKNEKMRNEKYSIYFNFSSLLGFSFIIKIYKKKMKIKIINDFINISNFPNFDVENQLILIIVKLTNKLHILSHLTI